MTIRSRLAIIALLPVVLSLLATVFALVMGNFIAKQRQDSDLAALIASEIFELNFITDRYLVYREAQIKEQWVAKHAAIGKRLSTAYFHADEGGELVSLEKTEHREIGEVFVLLSEFQPDRNVVSSRLAAARDERLSAILLIKVREAYSAAERYAAKFRTRTMQLRDMYDRIFLCLLFLFGVTVCTVALLSGRQILDGIGKLLDGTKSVAEGDLAFRIQKPSADELGILAASFNEMADRIEQLTTGLDQLVEHKTSALQAVNKELEAFSYSVSHDLRAPLRHMEGFVGLLQKRNAASLDEKGRHYLEMISEAGRKMSMLIDDLLSFSRMGRLEMARSEVPMKTLVEEVVAEMGRERDGLSVEWIIDPLPVVFGDPSMLRQVFVNLISNAVKFTGNRRQPRIHIGSFRNDEEDVLFVRDNGAGFDMKYADKLFGVFQRLHTTEFEGTGIGLANVRRIVARHGGRTWAEGEVDQGAVFYISLPRQNEHERESGRVEKNPPC